MVVVGALTPVECRISCCMDTAFRPSHMICTCLSVSTGIFHRRARLTRLKFSLACNYLNKSKRHPRVWASVDASIYLPWVSQSCNHIKTCSGSGHSRQSVSHSTMQSSHIPHQFLKHIIMPTSCARTNFSTSAEHHDISRTEKATSEPSLYDTSNSHENQGWNQT